MLGGIPLFATLCNTVQGGGSHWATLCKAGDRENATPHSPFFFQLQSVGANLEEEKLTLCNAIKIIKIKDEEERQSSISKKPKSLESRNATRGVKSEIKSSSSLSLLPPAFCRSTLEEENGKSSQ